MTRRAAPEGAASDRRRDARTFVLVVGLLGITLALGATVEAVLVLGAETSWSSPGTVIEWLARGVVNFLMVALVLLLALVLRVVDRPSRTWPLWTVALAALVAAVRVALQLVLGVYEPTFTTRAVSEAVLTGVVAVVVFAAAFGAVLLQRRARDAERARLQQSAQAADALAAVQQDELRMRRRIADGLHGSVQNSLVLIGARLNAVAETLGEPQRTEIASASAALDRLRQDEVRVLSAAVFPEGFDLGAIAAITAMLARVPAVIDVVFETDERARAVEGATTRLLGDEERLHLVRAAEEALTNALRHGNATRLAVSLTADDERITLRFDDDGRGLDPASPLSGLARMQNRFARAGGGLDVRDAPGGGVSLTAWLPLPERAGPDGRGPG